jgi:hypothetical protein
MPLTQLLRPAGIVTERTTGRVSNAEALLEDDGGEGVMVLERAKGDEVPVVVVDFGLNAVGTVEIDFAWSELDAEGGESDSDGEGGGGDGGDDDAGDLATRRTKGKKRNEHTRPGIRLAFSETLEFLSERSDFSRSDHVSL